MTLADQMFVKRQSSSRRTFDLSTLEQDRVFPLMIPKTADTYNATYKRLDRMEQRLKIEQEIKRAGEPDLATGLAVAIQKGYLTSNKINKFLEAEREEFVRRLKTRRRLRTQESIVVGGGQLRSAFFSRKLVRRPNQVIPQVFEPNFVHQLSPGAGLFKYTDPKPDLCLIPSQQLTTPRSLLEKIQFVQFLNNQQNSDVLRTEDSLID